MGSWRRVDRSLAAVAANSPLRSALEERDQLVGGLQNCNSALNFASEW